jgi:hypothetical protein
MTVLVASHIPVNQSLPTTAITAIGSQIHQYVTNR